MDQFETLDLFKTLVGLADKWSRMAEEEKDQGPGIDIAKILSIGFVVLNFAVVGGGAYLVYAGTLGHEQASISSVELNAEIEALRRELQTTPVIYNMETFNTNLEGLPRRFIRMELAVEMYDQEGYEELVTMGGEAQDAIMRIVNAKRLVDLDNVQGKLKLKTDVVSKLNTLMARGVVKNVYFTKFQVQ